LENKLKNYALNHDHVDSGGKAYWFKQVLGFDQSNGQDLADQIYFDESIAKPKGVNLAGRKYEEVLPIRGANGRTANVRVGFIKGHDGVVRLTSAYAGPK
jgi:filamentous hemagglutinin